MWEKYIWTWWMKSLESCSQCRPGSSCGMDLCLNRGECGWEWVTMIRCSEYVVILVDFKEVQWKITNITCIFWDSQTKTFYYSTFTSSFTAWRFHLIKEAEVLPYFHCIVWMLSYLTITFTTRFPWFVAKIIEHFMHVTSEKEAKILHWKWCVLGCANWSACLVWFFTSDNLPQRTFVMGWAPGKSRALK